VAEQSGTGCLIAAGVAVAAVAISIYAGVGLFLYGVVVLVFRNAFGIELPHPF
jgi:hypothetical protein